MDEFKTIEEIETILNIDFIIKYNEEEQYILDIFNRKNNFVFSEDNAIRLHINALYFYYVNNYDKMKYYYLKAIELNFSDSMNNLGFYYQYVEKNYDEMKKYYLMAIELNNTDAIGNLCEYYKTIKNYDEMEKYYLMAINLGDNRVAYNLGFHYQTIKNYDEMKKYYSVAISLNNNYALYNLGYHYQYEEIDYEKAREYFLLAVNFNNDNAMCQLKQHYNDLELYLFLKDIVNPCNLVQHALNNLLNQQSINNYCNKIKYFEKQNNSIIECDICYETKLNIPFECMHFCCVNCFAKMKKCHLCNR